MNQTETNIAEYLRGLKCFRVITKNDEHFCVTENKETIIKLVEGNPSSMGYDGNTLEIIDITREDSTSFFYEKGDMIVRYKEDENIAVYTDEVYTHLNSLQKDKKMSKKAPTNILSPSFFTAYNPIQKEMCDVTEIDFTNNSATLHNKDGHSYTFRLDKIKLLRYTSCSDKKDTPIYEDNILHTLTGRKRIVSFKDGCFGVTTEDEHFLPFSQIAYNTYLIVGNLAEGETICS